VGGWRVAAWGRQGYIRPALPHHTNSPPVHPRHTSPHRTAHVTARATPTSPSSPTAVTQWSKGEYPYASETEDDTALISALLPPRADDHGGAPGAATELAPAPLPSNPERSAAAAAGAVEAAGDDDWFAFTADAGVLRIALALTPNATAVNWPQYVRSNADLSLRVLDAAGAPLAAANPSPGMLWGGLSTRLPALGVYYLSIAGTGDAAGVTPGDGGYTAYGSLGEYRVLLEFVTPGSAGKAGSDPPPDPSAPDPTMELRIKVGPGGRGLGWGVGAVGWKGAPGRGVLQCTLIIYCASPAKPCQLRAPQPAPGCKQTCRPTPPPSPARSWSRSACAPAARAPASRARCSP
jgi:hypothetical protein